MRRDHGLNSSWVLGVGTDMGSPTTRRESHGLSRTTFLTPSDSRFSSREAIQTGWYRD